MALLRVWIVLLASRSVFGQAVGTPRTTSSVMANAAAPTITILTAATGALVRSQGASSSSLDLGRVSYFNGTSAPGETEQKHSSSFVISTRFALRVDCPGISSASKITVTMSRLDAAPSQTITIDGTAVGAVTQTLVQFMPCGSVGEHRMDVEVPVSTPAGLIGSTVAFVATLNK